VRAATASLFRYAVWASLRSPASLQRPAELAMGGGVVRLEPNRLLILEDDALGRPGVEVGARQTEPGDGITECSSMGAEQHSENSIATKHGGE